MSRMLSSVTQSRKDLNTTLFDARESSDIAAQHLKAERLLAESMLSTHNQSIEYMPLEAPEPKLRSESWDSVYDHRVDDAPTRMEYCLSHSRR